VIMGGAGRSFTLTVMVVEQASGSMAVMVYTVVVVGLAITVEPIVVFSPVDGDQLYPVAPVTCSVVLNPVHMETLLFPTAFGVGLIETVLLAVPVHPLRSVAVTL
jgi:hypothetical protein